MSHVIEFDADEIEAASHWHDGQSSMLYAICSTGTLALGTRRPVPDMSDDEWFSYLASNLEGEAQEALDMANDSLESAPDDEAEELMADIAALTTITAKALAAQDGGE